MTGREASDVLSVADLRLTVKAIRGYRGSIGLTARIMRSAVRAGRIVQLDRLEVLYGALAAAKSRQRGGE